MIFCNKLVCLSLASFFHHSLFFAGKAGANQIEGRLLALSTNIKIAKDKHSSSLQKLTNYTQKCFITLAPGYSVVFASVIEVLHLHHSSVTEAFQE